MSYSTCLYSLDLNELQSAVGSKDRQLIERVRKVEASRAQKSGMIPAEADPSKCPRVRVTRDGEIILNGQSISWDKFEASIVRPKWKATTLYLYVEGGGGKKRGKFENFGTFLLAINPLLEKSKIRGVTGLDHDPEELLNKEPKFSEMDTLAELIDGEVVRSDAENGHQYGYALEKLCRVLGKWLGNLSDVDYLELEIPFANFRAPVALPKIRDFPLISYLTADEVEREVKRLEALDLSDSDKSVQQTRKSFCQLLQKAAREKKAVVSFYY